MNYYHILHIIQELILLFLLFLLSVILHIIYTDKIIYTISTKLGRSNNSILNEIKKIIFNKFLEGKEYEEISNELNIEEENIYLIIRIYD